MYTQAKSSFKSAAQSLYHATSSSTRRGSRCIKRARCHVHMAFVMGILTPATILPMALAVASSNGICTGGTTTRRNLEKLKRKCCLYEDDAMSSSFNSCASPVRGSLIWISLISSSCIGSLTRQHVCKIFLAVTSRELTVVRWPLLALCDVKVILQSERQLDDSNGRYNICYEVRGERGQQSNWRLQAGWPFCRCSS